MRTMPTTIAARIARRANLDGWADVFGRSVNSDDVLAAWREGTHEHESFASFVLNEADEYGVTP